MMQDKDAELKAKLAAAVEADRTEAVKAWMDIRDEEDVDFADMLLFFDSLRQGT